MADSDTPTATPAAQVPAVRATSRRRILALTTDSGPLSRGFARLVTALRDAGHDVAPLRVPTADGGAGPDERAALSHREWRVGFTALARDLVDAIRGAPELAPDAMAQRLLEGYERDAPPHAVVAMDPAVAAAAFPGAEHAFPNAVRVAIDGDLHVDDAWAAVPFDDLATPHPGLGSAPRPVRGGQGRVRTGGLVVSGDGLAPKSLKGDGPQIVVSVSGLAAGQIDPLLFQLALVRRDDGVRWLFLPSGRTGLDELVRAKAGGHGVMGKRPKADADPEPWIRGAAALVGHPSPEEAAMAVAAGVPIVLAAPDRELGDGDRWLERHGLAEHVADPVGIAVALEALLPGGDAREAYEASLAEHRPAGIAGALEALEEAIAAGRPEPPPPATAALDSPTAQGVSDDEDELEDIGTPTATRADPEAPIALSQRLRRAYLKELQLELDQVQAQLRRARAGLETWQHRSHLARQAADATLEREARRRVDGLDRVASRLASKARELEGLRDRFTGTTPVRGVDRDAAARFLSAHAAAALDRLDRADGGGAFRKLELDEALRQLKARVDGA